MPRWNGQEAGGGIAGQVGLAMSVSADHTESKNLIFKATG